ncbi:hypothetical protein ACN9MZ_15505 [Pseudoduganella sp. S-14]|uniref:hypothetical protein n=1 Tax=Pseudoduganella sp. S-14 TaxID=3404065 RepID=UPI003CE94D9D
MMNLRFSLALLLVLGGVAHAAEICDAFPDKKTPIKELVAKPVAKRTDLQVMDLPRNGCVPPSKSVGILSAGAPVCLFRGRIPVKAVMLGQIDEAEGVEAMGLLMRGSREDIEFARAAFKDQKDITDEYQSMQIGTYFHGEANAWRRGDTFIIIGTHEPGYDPVEMALHLEMGTKRGLADMGKDLNSCGKPK